jgi:hypothetical protein
MMPSLRDEIRVAMSAVREGLAARERAREPVVVIDVRGDAAVRRTVAKMQAKGYVLDRTEPMPPGSARLRFRAG